MKFMSGPVFFDANVWVYAFAESGSTKGRRAEDVIATAGKILFTAQTVHETCWVLIRKYRYTEAQILEVIGSIFEFGTILSMEYATYKTASLFRAKHKIGH
jgi:predicted nucleic acid-binding protein